jgi:RNA polymerase sigma-70 factor (ECF subfamily)
MIKGRGHDSPIEKVPVELGSNSKEALSRFLADVERRAFKMAKFASRNTDEALDLVQEGMAEFMRRYSAQPQEKWKTLFYRILQSRITDWHRRSFVRKRVLSWLGRTNEEEDQGDPLQNLADPTSLNPYDHAVRQEEMRALEKAIQTLPLRQQQAFLLRAWEGMDVLQAALAMGCAEGSVKTHYSRAVHTLRGLLEGVRT